MTPKDFVKKGTEGIKVEESKKTIGKTYIEEIKEPVKWEKRSSH